MFFLADCMTWGRFSTKKVKLSKGEINVIRGQWVAGAVVPLFEQSSCMPASPASLELLASSVIRPKRWLEQS